jgi:HEPN/Toprim N-terminal domain 1
MGTILNFSLGNLELDWGKASSIENHSVLFLPVDIRPVSYYYPDELIVEKPAFVRSLRLIVRRLDLLGYTIEECRRRYEAAASTTPTHYPAPVLSFDQFADALSKVDIEAFVRSDPDEYEDYDLGEFVTSQIFADPEFTKINKRLESLVRDDGIFFENLEPHLILRLLAENSQNLDREVVWRFADFVDAGWYSEEDVYYGIQQRDRCLLVTEGSSDGAILRRALPIVAPDVEDFFEFVDMSENYPFTGTGNLVRFCQGLARIKIQNRILVVVDNDTAGREARSRIVELDLPPLMRIAVLPDLEECRTVKTLGPTGEHSENINGRALSIEWFLNTSIDGHPEPTVRWTSYSERQRAYQGELVNKAAYTRNFFETANNPERCDWSKLRLLWDHLIAACIMPAKL